jgi:D-xylose transport system permease protein
VLFLWLGSPIVVGLVIGAVHGSLVSYGNIPAFIVTLGGMLAWAGVTLGLTKGETITVTIPGFRAIGEQYIAPAMGIGMAILAIAAIAWLNLRRNSARRRHNLAAPALGATVARIALPALLIIVFVYLMNLQGGVPISVFIMVVVALTGAFLTQNTTFGRYLYAIGGNPDAARLSGINLRRRILVTFCIMGALAGVAALIHTARQGSATPEAGKLMELDAIAACVIGGTSLMGGRGTVFGAILGALIMASLDNGMSLLNYQSYVQPIVKGTVLVAAVGFDMLGRRRS